MEYKSGLKDNSNTIVNNGTLEIHLFWAVEGTVAIPTRGVHGPLISAISAVNGMLRISICFLFSFLVCKWNCLHTGQNAVFMLIHGCLGSSVSFHTTATHNEFV